MARVLADENFPLPVTAALRSLGHDVKTLQEIDKAGQSLSDQAVLELASQDRRAVLTINRKHFVHLHRANSEHFGIVACTLDLDFTGQASRIHASVASQPRLEGILLRVNRPAPSDL